MNAAPPPLRVLCDVDGVLADFVGLVLEYAHSAYGLCYRREAVDQWDCFGALGMPTEWPRFRTWCDELRRCASMLPVTGAASFYSELRRLVAATGKGAALRVCTTPMTVSWLSQRAEWLVEFGIPLSEQLHVHDKQDLTRSACGGSGFDVLIDDRVENCEAFVRAGGRAFCIATPYNTHVAAHVPRGTHAFCVRWLEDLAGVRAASEAQP